MADMPGHVTRALTLKGAQYNWAILNGYKIIENRTWRIKPGWYALHTGLGATTKEVQLRMRSLVSSIPEERSLTKGVIVGAVHISHSLDQRECTICPWATGPVCNIVSDVVVLPTPVPHKGALSCWKISADVLPRIQASLASQHVRSNAQAIAELGLGRGGPAHKRKRIHETECHAERPRSAQPPASTTSPEAAGAVAATLARGSLRAMANATAADLRAMGFAAEAVAIALRGSGGNANSALELLLAR